MSGAPGPGTVVATLQAFLEGTEALRAVLLLDRGPDLSPAVVDCLLDGSAELVEGDEARPVPEEEWTECAPLGPLPELRAFAPVEVDVAAGTVTGPLGALDHVGRAVRDTVALFGGASVLTVGLESTDPEAPLFLSARTGEPLVASVGGSEYELPAGWP